MERARILELYFDKPIDKITSSELESITIRGKYIDSLGYVRVLMPHHPKANAKGYVAEHVVEMEIKLGRQLNTGEVVHHIDENPSNNHPENLELFNSIGSHRSHHQRMKAFKACGHYEWRQCCYCHQWDDPKNMVIYKRSARHRLCTKKHNEKRHPNRRLPREEAALVACGNPTWRKCCYCKEYDDPKNLYISPNKATCYHRKCMKDAQKERMNI